MNLVLFEPGPWPRLLPAGDARAVHVRTVLRRGPGEPFEAGVEDGARGWARWSPAEGGAGAVRIDFEAVVSAAAPPEPGTLLVGLCRPQTVRKIVREAAAVGVARLVFLPAGRSEPSYARSTLWSGDEVHRLLVEAAGQAGTTRLAACLRVASWAEAVGGIPPADGAERLALDVYAAAAPPLAAAGGAARDFVLAVGPERGWDEADRAVLRAAGFAFARLGPRILRTETAAVAGLVLLRRARGLL